MDDTKVCDFLAKFIHHDHIRYVIAAVEISREKFGTCNRRDSTFSTKDIFRYYKNDDEQFGCPLLATTSGLYEQILT